MKRFVDIRAAETGWRFAWWDTVTDRFEDHGGQQAWDTFDEFASMYVGSELDRYRRLAPVWAFFDRDTCADEALVQKLADATGSAYIARDEYGRELFRKEPRGES